MKLFGAAQSAQVRHVDATGRDAGGEELGAVGAGEVDVRSSLLSEMRGDFGAHLVAAPADAGADGGVQVRRGGAEAARAWPRPRGRRCARRCRAIRHELRRRRGDARPPAGSGMQSAVLTATTRAGRVFEQRIAFAEDARCGRRRRRSRPSGFASGWRGCANSAGMSARRVPKPWTSQGSASSSVTR